MASYVGTSGDDTETGTSGDDEFDYSQGGNDTLTGGAGINYYGFGDTFHAGDQVNGASGYDVVVLLGDYAKTVFTDAMMTGVERLELTGAHRYILTLANANANASGGLQLVVGAEASGRINATHVHDFSVQFLSAAAGGVVLRGGDQSDNFQFTNGMDRTLVVDGGGGDDNYVTSYGTAHIHFADHSFVNISNLLYNGDTRLTFADGNIAAGKTLTITDQSTAFDNLIDGHKELDGQFYASMGAGADTVIGGHQSDTLFGNGGNDRIVGGQGQDLMAGGGGADTFAFYNAGDSRRGHADLITDLENADHIDLSRIDGDETTDGKQHFHKVGAFTGAAGELTVSYDAGHSQTVILGDTDGDGKAEFELRISGDHTGFSGLVL